jgi:hypothetical protein
MRIQPEDIPTLVEKKGGMLSSNPCAHQGSLSYPWKAQKQSKREESCDSQLNNKRKRSPLSKEPSKKKIKSGKYDTTISISLTTKGFKRHFAEHNYHDYAQLKPSELDPDKIKATQGGVHNPFPAVLHKMMEDAEDKDFTNVVSWQSHGRAFLIHEPKTFVADVLPKYFKHSKLSSLQRQLSLYGFVRLTQDGRDRGAYYNERFLRGRPFLCSKIQRTRVKGTWVRTSSSPEAEPNFYAMEQVCDLDDLLDSRQVEQSSSPSIEDSQSSSDHDDDERSQQHTSCEQVLSADNTDFFVEKHIDDVLLALCSDKRLESSKSLFGFLDVRKLKSGGDRKPVSQLLAESGLQPPPPFPSTVVSQTPNKSNLTLPTLLNTEDYSSSAAFYPPKLPFMDVQHQRSLTPSLLGANIPSFASIAADDDEQLALFLTDVDLDTDFDTDDVMQVTSI